MSGIYGVVTNDGTPVAQETLAPLAAAMSFYGPDGHGQWRGESAGLGHLMLHVTAESVGERQPASLRAAPHLIITADARIDNRDELFDALRVGAAGRDQTPDSSLILLAYERWGAECPKKLLGDFAFAIWNSRERSLFCARDPFGCKPFFYLRDGRRFVFASDINGVLACVESPRLNEPLVAAYLQMKTYYAQKRLTFFENVVKLEPGHSAVLRSGELNISRYWSPEDVAEVRDSDGRDSAEHLGFLFRQAVACRVRSAFPVGSHLSGGVDSSSVCIVASRQLGSQGKELAAFSYSPAPGAGAPKGEYARIDAVCRQEKIACEFMPATVASLIEMYRRDFTREPVAMIAREASVQARAKLRGVRVMLSGWGGDEAVTCRYDTSLVEHLRKCDWPSFRDAVQSRRFAGVIRELVMVGLPDSLYPPSWGNAGMRLKRPCIRDEFERRYRQEVDSMRAPLFRRLPGIRGNICRYLEGGHLSYRTEHWAASGARHGLVYRYPMLDRRLVEIALMTGNEQRRQLFIRALDELLPSGIDRRPVKDETITLTALQTEYIKSHSEWARRLASQPATTFVDYKKMQVAVDAAVKSGNMRDLSGVREAFGCYALATPGQY